LYGSPSAILRDSEYITFNRQYFEIDCECKKVWKYYEILSKERIFIYLLSIMSQLGIINCVKEQRRAE
jgi:hypothetical protein